MARKANPEIERFILESVEEHPQDIVALTAGRFEISRQAAHRHVRKLVEQNFLTTKGVTTNRSYQLSHINIAKKSYSLRQMLSEDTIWFNDFDPLLIQIPKNIKDICYYGVTEILNNAIEHSQGKTLSVILSRTAASLIFAIQDDGIGIFRNIREALKLADDRQVLLELTKGKLTTKPSNHTGQGIFFTSRMFDFFSISSGKSEFLHSYKHDDWLLTDSDENIQGTRVLMTLSVFETRTTQDIFDKFADAETFAFNKTHVPLKLASIGEDSLISRSQAKRVLARFDKFEEVYLDFSGVKSIGQAFADEIFRVFANAHPEVKLVVENTTPEIEKMISRAKNTKL